MARNQAAVDRTVKALVSELHVKMAKEKVKRTCVACGRKMTVRADGAPFHKRCGESVGMA